MKFIASFFFLIFFSTTVLAGNGKVSSKPTTLLPEKVDNTPVIVQVTVQEGCRGEVVYYHSPGITAGGSVWGGALSTAFAGSWVTNAFSASLSTAGGGGVFGTTGQTFPVITSCFRKGGKNE